MKVIGARATNLIQKKKRGVQGKISRKRQKDNSLAQTLKIHAKSIVESSEISKSASDSLLTESSPHANKIFSKVNINIADLNKTLSTQCVPVTKYSIPKHFPKKEKRKLRHEAFVKKIETFAETKQRKKKRRNPLKTIGDMDIEPEVPTAVPEAAPQSTDSNQPSEPTKKQKKAFPENLSKKPIPKTKKRVEQDLRDIQLFNEVMSNAVYQSNPGQAITNYVLHRVRESIQTEPT